MKTKSMIMVAIIPCLAAAFGAGYFVGFSRHRLPDPYSIRIKATFGQEEGEVSNPAGSLRQLQTFCVENGREVLHGPTMQWDRMDLSKTETLLIYRDGHLVEQRYIDTWGDPPSPRK